MTKIRAKLKVYFLDHASLQPTREIELTLIVLSHLASPSHQPFACQ